MAYIVADRIKETTTTQGTGAISLAGAVSGYRTFASQMSVGDTCAYAIVSATGLEWEVGIATYSAVNTLTRTTVQSSTNANALVNFSVGLKDVFLGPTAGSVPGFNPITNTITGGTWGGNTIDVAHGGTGLTALGTANQVLSVNPAGTALEYHTITSNPGTVTSVGGTGTVNGLTLTGIVTSSGNLTLGGTLAVDPSQVTGTAVITTDSRLSDSRTPTGSAGGVLAGTYPNPSFASTTGSGAVVLATSPTLVTPKTNSIAAVTVTGTSAGNTLALAASNASTTGAGGNVTITGGNGSGVGAGGNIILQPGAQGTSGGNGVTVFRNSAGVEKGRVLESGQFISSTAGVGFGWAAAGATSITHGLRCNNPGQGYITIQGQGNNIFSVDSNNGQTCIAAPSSSPNWRFLLVNATNSESSTGAWGLSCSASNGVAIVRDGAASIAGGSFAFPPSTTAIATNQNDLILTGSAFQRLNCTSPSSITGIAPPTGGAHVDGRMIRIYNVGGANLTLSHNSAASTTTNRFWNSTGADIVLSTHQYVELIYDSTDNGRGGAGWRVSSVH